MSLQLKQTRNWRRIGVASAVVIGTSLIVLKTFPHLRQSIYGYLKGSKDQAEDEEEEDNTPIELTEESTTSAISPTTDIADESIVDLNEWSTDDLKGWLKSKEVNAPENSSHSNLVSLVKSFQESP